ncbi:hypothetical protein [Paraburkholderia acidipaludis]|uniref:hypothetical protein n=1 Tax=Paraburkholderia acidipaludis TaxID=660537 RepID=UPI001FDF5569|nr:hypothetical protein [Paraburkholderia acidipaludis]
MQIVARRHLAGGRDMGLVSRVGREFALRDKGEALPAPCRDFGDGGVRVHLAQLVCRAAQRGPLPARAAFRDLREPGTGPVDIGKTRCGALHRTARQVRLT